MNLFSGQHLASTFKAAFLALILVLIAAAFLFGRLDHFSALLGLDLPSAFERTLAEFTVGFCFLLIALAIFALVDVPLQRFMWAKRLRMSHQELKEESKELEGNPEVRVQLRQRMRELSRRRMLAAVKKADLVLVNPTHYAVAIKYDDATMNAPRVVAKGADLLALRMRELAKDRGVPVMRAPALARALYTHAELDREIPAALFSAVAQVLAWLYQLRASRLMHRPEPPQPQHIPVPVELDPHSKTEGASA